MESTGNIPLIIFLPGIFRDELREAAAAFREKDAEHKNEVESLEDELDELRKAHAR